MVDGGGMVDGGWMEERWRRDGEGVEEGWKRGRNGVKV